MKPHIKYLTLLALVFCLSSSALSQKVTVSANINVGAPTEYSYYYYPDYEIYYRVETGTWFIRRNAIWVSYYILPMEYYFIRYPGCERVRLPYHGSKYPFAYHHKFKNAYPKHSKKSNKKNYVDYKMNTIWKSEKPNAHMKTKISNKPSGGGGGKLKGKLRNR